MTWYDDMAAAMRQRDRCLNAIERWHGALAEAEGKIKLLAADAPHLMYGSKVDAADEAAETDNGTNESASEPSI
jgi:hypothetical protein